MVDVAVFVRSFEGGGAERVAGVVATQLHRTGLEVDVIVQYNSGPWATTLDPLIRVVELGDRLRWSLVKLHTYLRTERPSSLISFGMESNIVAALVSSVSRWNGRLVVSERISIEYQREQKGRWWPIYSVGLRFAYSFADAVIAVSRQLADSLVDEIGVDGRKVVAIPNPLDVDAIRETARLAWTQSGRTHGGTRVVVAAGRLVPQKGFDTLIEAFRVAFDHDDRLRLVILGEGPMRGDLERQIVDSALGGVVSMPGFVDPLVSSLAGADVFVLSSRYEGWPNALAEALALHLRVVATDCPTGPRELLAEGRFGRLVPVEDSAEMAKSIIAACNDRVDGDAIDQWLENLSVDEVVGRYRQIILPETKVGP